METLYYNLQDPPQWDPQPEDLPSDSGAVLVMRHSVRYPMVAGQFGTQIELTPIGIERANELGRDRKSTRLNSSHSQQSRMPSSA